MNRTEAEKVARRIVNDVCARDMEQDAFLTGLLESGGYSIGRVRHDHMDGFDNGGGFDL